MNFYSNLYHPHDRLKAISLLIAVLVVYLPFLNNPLIFDDISFFKNPISNFADAPFFFQFRWFPYTSLGFTWAFFDEAPPVFRLGNLLLHALNTLLILLVFRLWISFFITEPARNKLANFGAWLGSLIFALHPLATYATGYLVQRSILMALLFNLIMHLAYFRGLLEGSKRYAALAVAAYFLAVFSKEHSLLIPAILLPLTWILRRQIKLPKLTLLLTWLGFTCIAVLMVLRAKGVLGQVYEMDTPALIGQGEMLKGLHGLHLLSVLTQAGLFFKYLALMLLPNPAWMSIDMREVFLLNWQDWRNWLGALAFVVYGVVALGCLLRGKQRVALFGLALLYPWLLFFTEFSTIRVQEIFVLYRAYLWMPGLMLLLPLLASFMPDKKIVWMGALLALLLLPLAWNRLWVMADNYRLWNDAAKLLPQEKRLGANRIYYNRGYYAATDHGDWSAAIVDYQQSVQISGNFPKVRIALAGAYANAGRIPEAIIEYNQIVKSFPANADVLYERALFLQKLDDRAGAQSSMQKSCDLGKNLACAMVNLSASLRH